MASVYLDCLDGRVPMLMTLCSSRNVGSTGSYNTIKGMASSEIWLCSAGIYQTADYKLSSGGALPATEQGRAWPRRGVDCRLRDGGHM